MKSKKYLFAQFNDVLFTLNISNRYVLCDLTQDKHQERSKTMPRMKDYTTIRHTDQYSIRSKILYIFQQSVVHNCMYSTYLYSVYVWYGAKIRTFLAIYLLNCKRGLSLLKKFVKVTIFDSFTNFWNNSQEKGN